MTDDPTLPWQDTSRRPAERAADLLGRMTLTEKVQQLGSSWPGQDPGGEVAPMQETFDGARPFEEEIQGGLGQITRAFGTAPVEPALGRKRLADLQRQVVAANRFGIPAMAHEECLTGVTAWKATVYPTPLAWGASWDPGLVREMAAAIGRDLAGLGVHQGLSPVLDVVRDYRWGRVEETIGEDPYLVADLGTAYVEGLQSAGVVATLKHFAGYSTSRGARNHAPATVGPRELADVVLVPFERAVRAGVRSVMNSYADLDGVPPAADPWLLTELLRDTWGFEGTVVSDYWAIPFLDTTHRVAADLDEAGRLALTAGLDVELPHSSAYGVRLTEMVHRGAVSEDLVDRAALRVLRQKAELGLLDPTWAPVEGPGTVDLDTAANRQLALRLARESIVLLHNDSGVLPLREPARLAVVGPGADDAACLFGCYSFPNHVVAKTPGLDIGVAAPTVLEALRAALPRTVVDHAAGCGILHEPTADGSTVEDAVALAREADLVVVVVGDRSGMFGHGTSGEGCDVLSLSLPGDQQDLVEQVLGTGRPVVLVVLSGRPYAVGSLAARAAAVLQCFFPGEEGGTAVADVITGVVNPSGHLPVQIPGDRAAQPSTYLGPLLAQDSDGVSSLDPTPAYPFGHGASYTSFAVDDLRVDEEEVPIDGTVRLSATVTNTGPRDGATVVQAYLSDPVASVTRPVRALVGYRRVELAAGESRQVTVEVHSDLASYTGRDLRRRVDPGALDLSLGLSAADAAGRTVRVHVRGDAPRFPGHARVMTSRVTVRGASDGGRSSTDAATGTRVSS